MTKIQVPSGVLSRFFIMLGLLVFIVVKGGFAGELKGLLDSDSVLAKIGKEEITLQDIEDRKVNQLRKNLYDEIKVRVQAKLVEKLMKDYPKYSKRKKPDISKEAIMKFYNANSLNQRGPLKDWEPKIKQFLSAKEDALFYDTVFQQAIKDGVVKTALKEPTQFLVTVPAETAFLWGNQKEKVMVLEFSDYQCPFCKKVQPTLTRLRNKYKNKVLFGYRHFPLQFHTEADEAAIAAECARDQGKFEAYHFLMFTKQKQQFPKDLKRYARDLKIKDLKLFDKCLDKDTYRSRVQNDIKVAASVGISGTPSFIVGKYNPKNKSVSGEVFSGALPETHFLETIDKYLK
ncbi:MAG: thioredoxin domain-containing protein [Deltaproteobacteria bacterium]|nr:thioredoxin domain-containing protein [Deltaproteobacteria bacterium]